MLIKNWDLCKILEESGIKKKDTLLWELCCSKLNTGLKGRVTEAKGTHAPGGKEAGCAERAGAQLPARPRPI